MSFVVQIDSVGAVVRGQSECLLKDDRTHISSIVLITIRLPSHHAEFRPLRSNQACRVFNFRAPGPGATGDSPRAGLMGIHLKWRFNYPLFYYLQGSCCPQAPFGVSLSPVVPPRGSGRPCPSRPPYQPSLTARSPVAPPPGARPLRPCPRPPHPPPPPPRRGHGLTLSRHASRLWTFISFLSSSIRDSERFLPSSFFVSKGRTF